VKVTVLCVGGVKGPLATIIHEYEERAGHYWRFNTVELEGGIRKSAKAPPEEVVKAEGERILRSLPDGGEVVALTRSGKKFGSRELSALLEDWALRSVPEVTFVIGGAHGLGDPVLRRSSQRLSLSSLTLPHEVARLILVEQVYRAGTICRNEPYHKGP